MTPKANIMSLSHLHHQMLVIRELFPLLRHLNAGTLSVVMMVALALLNAMRGTDSALRRPVVDNAMMSETAADSFRVWLETSTPPGVQKTACFDSPVQSCCSRSGFYKIKARPESNRYVCVQAGQTVVRFSDDRAPDFPQYINKDPNQ